MALGNMYTVALTIYSSESNQRSLYIMGRVGHIKWSSGQNHTLNGSQSISKINLCQGNKCIKWTTVVWRCPLTIHTPSLEIPFFPNPHNKQCQYEQIRALRFTASNSKNNHSRVRDGVGLDLRQGYRRLYWQSGRADEWCGWDGWIEEER